MIFSNDSSPRAVHLLEQKIQLLKILLERSKIELQKCEKTKGKGQGKKEGFFEVNLDKDLRDFYNFREKIIVTLFEINERIKTTKIVLSFPKKSNSEGAPQRRNSFLKEEFYLLKKEEDLLKSILLHDEQIFFLIEKQRLNLLKIIHAISSDKKQLKSYKSSFGFGIQREIIK